MRAILLLVLSSSIILCSSCREKELRHSDTQNLKVEKLQQPKDPDLISSTKKFTINGHKIVVTYESLPYITGELKGTQRAYGLFYRPYEKLDNRKLSKVTIQIDNKPYSVPESHLIGLLNPKDDHLSVEYDNLKNDFSVDIFGGYTGTVYDVNFIFKNGSYIKRSICYTGRSTSGPESQHVDDYAR